MNPPLSPELPRSEIRVVDVRDPADTLPLPPGDPLPGRRRVVDVKAPLLNVNDRVAAQNRAWLRSRGIVAFNLVSSPGAGKTTLLQRTLAELESRVRCAILVGDLETDNDARRLHRPGVPVVQITTGGTCHLDAAMVARGLEALALDGVRFLFIENVGNLVCPASFDLGENRRVVLLACTEGEDKPLKYPPLFSSAHVVLLTKRDLADAAGCDRPAMLRCVRQVAPHAPAIELSARTGEGFGAWVDYLHGLI